MLPALDIDASEPFEDWPEEVTCDAGNYALLFSRSAGNPKVEPSPTVSAPVLMSFTFAPLPSPRVRSNVVHIAPWAVARGIFSAASVALRPGGALVFHGPFKESAGGTDKYFVEDSNLRFCDPALWDEQMRGFDGEGWGIRTIGEMTAEATKHGLALRGQCWPVGPSQNFLLLFIKDS